MKDLNKFLNIVILLGCVTIAAFMFFYKVHQNELPQTTEQSSVRPKSNDPQDLANKYLQEAQRNVTADSLRASVNMQKAISDVDDPKIMPVKEIDPATVPAARQIWKDPQRETARTQTLEERFSEEMNRAQYNQLQDEADRKEYIRQYKENARKAGYEITISDDLEVTNVRPIRKPGNDYDSNESEEQEY